MANRGWSYNISKLPYSFYDGSAVVVDDEIHILGGNYNGTKHYSWKWVYYYNTSSTWTELYKLPYSFYYGGAAYYNNRIYIFGGSGSDVNTKCYSAAKTNWTNWRSESNIPFPFTAGSVIIYNGKIHLLGSSETGYKRYHYSFDGTNWTQETDLPYDFYYGTAVVYNDKIHILGGYSSTNHYSFDGTSWAHETDLPYAFMYGQALTWRDEIHMFGGSGNTYNHYLYNGTTWTKSDNIPSPGAQRFSAVVFDDAMYILSGYSVSNAFFYYSQISNKVIYGDEVVMDISHDDINVNDVVYGKHFHTRNGSAATGSRERYTKYNCSGGLVYFSNPIYVNEEYDITLMEVAGREILLGLSSNNVQLKAEKDDGTISAVTIASPTAANKTTFRITNIYFLSLSFFIIQYTYATSATADYNLTLRGITIKNDGTILASAATNISGVSSATLETKAYVIPALYAAQTDFIFLRKHITKSTGAYLITAYRGYITTTTGAITIYTNAALVNIASNANTYLPDFDMCPQFGGFFYRNASAVDYVCMFGEYRGSARAVTLANAGTDIATVGALNHHILGPMKNGVLVTAKEDTGFYFWNYDNSQATNMFKLLGSVEFTGFGKKNTYVSGEGTYPITMDADTRVIIYSDEYHFFRYYDHYKYEEGTWTKLEDCPVSVDASTPIVVGEQPIYGIHIFKGTTHCAWNYDHYETFNDITTYDVTGALAIYDYNLNHGWGGIMLIGGGTGYENKTLIWTSGDTVELGPTISTNVSSGAMALYSHGDSCIYLATSSSLYKFDGTSWQWKTSLPYDISTNKGFLFQYDHYGSLHLLMANGTKTYSYILGANSFSSDLKDDLQFAISDNMVIGSHIDYYIAENSCVDIFSGTNTHFQLINTSYKRKIVAFSDDVVIFDDGSRMQLQCERGGYANYKELSALNNVYVDSYGNLMDLLNQGGPESSIFNNVMIYGGP